MSENKKQTIEWFKDQEMSQVICHIPGGKQATIDIMSEKDAVHYFEMQDRGYFFEKKLTVHKAPGASCGSCEG